MEAGDCDAPYMSTLWHDGRVVGETTSGACGYRVGKSIALGMLRADLAVPGTELEVEIFGERLHGRGAGRRTAVGSEERKNSRMKIVLTDGGMGQELIRRSGKEPTPLWSARVLLDEPELVRDLHVDFIRAGARVITINTYSATPERLARDGMDGVVRAVAGAGPLRWRRRRARSAAEPVQHRRLPAAAVCELSPGRGAVLRGLPRAVPAGGASNRQGAAISSCARLSPR